MFWEYMILLWDTHDLFIRWTESNDETIEIICLALGGPF